MDVIRKRKRKFLFTFIIAASALITMDSILIYDSINRRNELKKYDNFLAKVTMVSGDVSLVENGGASPLNLHQEFILDNKSYLLLTKGSKVTLAFNDKSIDQYEGPLMLPIQRIYNNKISWKIAGIDEQIISEQRTVIFITVLVSFFMVWLYLCYHRNSNLSYPFYLSLLGLILFGMVFLTIHGLKSLKHISLFLSLMVYPFLFLLSLFLLPKREDIPESEAMETKAVDLLYEGLSLFDSGKMEEALKKFHAAHILSPKRSDIKNLIGIMEMKINDPEKLERIAVLKRKLDNSFRKKLSDFFMHNNKKLGITNNE